MNDKNIDSLLTEINSAISNETDYKDDKTVISCLSLANIEKHNEEQENKIIEKNISETRKCTVFPILDKRRERDSGVVIRMFGGFSICFFFSYELVSPFLIPIVIS